MCTCTELASVRVLLLYFSPLRLAVYLTALPLTENAYEVSPTPESPVHAVTNALYSPSGDPLINNPLYTMSSTSTTPEHTNTEFDMSTSPAYSRVREINNPLYGEKSPARTGDPVYAELEGPSQKPQKGSVNYPYSYADLQRRPTGGVAPPTITTPPHYEQQYEVVQLKPDVPEETTVPHKYDVPKPVSSPPPSPYEVPTTATPPGNKLGNTLKKENLSKKKSIYDSDEDVSAKPVPKPRPPPRPSQAPRPVAKPRPSQPPVSEEYSYAILDSARGGSVKIKQEVGQGEPPPYNQLEHDLGPDVVTQVRLAAIDGSGYQALEND